MKRGEYPPHMQRAIAAAEAAQSVVIGLPQGLRNGSAVHEFAIPADVRTHHFGKGRMPESTYRSQLERDYADHLERLRLAGEVMLWIYEPFTLHLGGEAGTRKGVKYKVDWLVLPRSLEIELHETKGFFRRGERERLKLAAARYPFIIKAVTREEERWIEELF